VLGDSNALHDRITQLKGSFDKTMQGIENLGRFCVNVVTNTVVTSMNYERLQKIVGLISRYKHIKMMHFWNYWPMSKNDQDNMLVDLKIVAPCLKKAIEKCIDYRIKPVVKHFPACILGKYRNHLEDCGGLVIIDGKYWDEHKNNEFEQCKHKSVCNAKICDGLTTAYINKFGWEEDFLKPVKRDKESRNKNKFTPEFNMRKFMSHKKAFHIRDCSCVGLLENVIKKSRDFELECSVKVDGERVYPSRFNVYYHKANKRNLSLVFGFIKDVAKASGAVIDYSLIKNIIKKSDLAKMKNVVVGIDARENKKDSRIKLWFMIGNYPKKIEEIIRMFPKKDMVRDLVKDELLFGFDFFFDGRKAMKIYPSLSFDDINDKQMLKRIGQEFTKKTVPLMRKCKKVNISFKECSKDASFHFEVESLGVFMDNIGNNNTLKEVKKRIGKNAGNRGIISLNKKEIESSRFSSINIYY